MKRNKTFRALLLLLALCLLVGSAATVGAKYIKALTDKDGGVTAPAFYFRSNVLSEESDPTPITINGSETTAVLSNAIGDGKISDVTITYTLSYYVYKDDAWVLASTESDKTFEKDVLSTDELTLTPIEYGGTTYETIKVVATATAPFAKTLTAIISFYPAPFTVSYTYDSASYVITAMLKVGSAGGGYTLSWITGVSPDNADENGFLTEAAIGPSSVSVTLSEHHTYLVKFFVTDSDLHDTILASGDINAYLSTVVPISAND